jgi:hypothetical protein
VHWFLIISRHYDDHWVRRWYECERPGGVSDEEEKGAEEGSTAEVHADSPYVDVDYKVHRPRQVH